MIRAEGNRVLHPRCSPTSANPSRFRASPTLVAAPRHDFIPCTRLVRIQFHGQRCEKRKKRSRRDGRAAGCSLLALARNRAYTRALRTHLSMHRWLIDRESTLFYCSNLPCPCCDPRRFCYPPYIPVYVYCFYSPLSSHQPRIKGACSRSTRRSPITIYATDRGHPDTRLLLTTRNFTRKRPCHRVV